MDPGMASLVMNGVLGLLAWSFKSKHDDAMKRLEKTEAATLVANERLAKVETKQDGLTETLREIKDDIKVIREKVENK